MHRDAYEVSKCVSNTKQRQQAGKYTAVGVKMMSSAGGLRLVWVGAF